MTALDLLHRLRAAGVTVRADGDTLRLRHTTSVPDDLVAEARAMKPDLLALVRREAIIRLTPDLRDHFEERAAIREYDGEMTREAAEAAALLDVLGEARAEAA